MLDLELGLTCARVAEKLAPLPSEPDTALELLLLLLLSPVFVPNLHIHELLLHELQAVAQQDRFVVLLRVRREIAQEVVQLAADALEDRELVVLVDEVLGRVPEHCEHIDEVLDLERVLLRARRRFRIEHCELLDLHDCELQVIAQLGVPSAVRSVGSLHLSTALPVSGAPAASGLHPSLLLLLLLLVSRSESVFAEQADGHDDDHDHGGAEVLVQAARC